MKNVYDLFIFEKYRIKVGFDDSGRVWFFRVIQSRSSKRYKNLISLSVKKILPYLINLNNDMINFELLNLLKKKETKSVRYLIRHLKDMELISN